MKKIMNKINFALVAIMASVPAFAAENEMCVALQKLHGVFNLLRTLAFIGAAFYIAQWAWKYISSGDVKMDDIKNQGTALIVGFSLLFLVGVILSFVMSATGAKFIGCTDVLKTW